MKRCQSCGKLIELFEDFAGLDQSSIYCSSCADGSGKLRSFEEVLENLTQRIAKTDGFDESASRNAALQILGRQPAWEPKFKREEKVKNNRRSIIYIAVAIGIVLTSSICTFFMTKPKVGWEQEYDKYFSSYDDPFGSINTNNENGLEITELKCKGNQEIKSLENGILQFSSSDAIIKSKFNNDIKLVDTSNYITNLCSGRHMKIVDFTNNESKQNSDQKMKIKEVIDGRLKKISWIVPCLSFIGSYKKSLIEDLSFEEVVKNARTSVLQTNYDILKETFDYTSNTVVDQKHIVYEDESIMLCTFPASPSNEYNNPPKIFLFKTKINDPIASFVMSDKHALFVDQKGSKVLINLQNKLSLSQLSKFAIIDVEKRQYTEIDGYYQTDKTKIIRNTCSIVYEDVYGSRKFVIIDFINSIKKTIFEDDYYSLEGGFIFNGQTTLLLSKFESANSMNKLYYIYDIYSKKTVYLMNGNFTIQFNCGDYLVFSDYVEKNNINIPIDRKRDYKLMIINIKNPIITILNNDSPILGKNIYCDGNYIAWVKNAGEIDDQWKNICYAKLSE